MLYQFGSPAWLDVDLAPLALDATLLGIDTDFSIHIRADVMQESDGPMLEHGIKEMDKGKLWVPPSLAEQPDSARLEVRFKEFSDQ